MLNKIGKNEVIKLIRKQLKVEVELIRSYKEAADTLENKPARHLLKMIEIDSMKHKDLCQLALTILQGHELIKPSEEHFEETLKPHHDLEEGAIERLNTRLKNSWIKQNKGLTALIKNMRDDEKHHHDSLESLIEKSFVRMDPGKQILSPVVMDSMVRFLFTSQ